MRKVPCILTGPVRTVLCSMTPQGVTGSSPLRPTRLSYPNLGAQKDTVEGFLLGCLRGSR